MTGRGSFPGLPLKILGSIARQDEAFSPEKGCISLWMGLETVIKRAYVSCRGLFLGRRGFISAKKGIKRVGRHRRG